MKTSEEMTASVLDRVHAYEKAKTRRQKKLRRAAGAGGIVCAASAVTALGLFLLKSPAAPADPPFAAETAAETTARTLPGDPTGGDPAAVETVEIHGVSVPLGETEELPRVRRLIESMPGTVSDKAYVPVGEVGLSLPLQAALETYEDEPLYRVAIIALSDPLHAPEGHELTEDPAELEREVKRLGELGYTVAIEQFMQDKVVYRTLLTIHATREQILAFPAVENYGCLLALYGEVAPGTAPETGVVNEYSLPFAD